MTRIITIVYFSGSILGGPGADHKYKTEQEKKDEEAKKKGKKRKILLGGLGGGLVIGGLLGYKAGVYIVHFDHIPLPPFF